MALILDKALKLNERAEKSQKVSAIIFDYFCFDFYVNKRRRVPKIQKSKNTYGNETKREKN